MGSKKIFRNRLSSEQHLNLNEKGLALAIVLMSSAIAATATMAVAIRSYNHYVNSTRQSLADRAKDAA